VDGSTCNEYFSNYQDIVKEKRAYFAMLLYRDYWEYLRDFSENPSLDKGKALVIAFNRLYIDICVVDRRDDCAKVNVTLTFTDGIAKMGKEYSPKPKIDSSWSNKGDYYLSVFNKLIMSRIVTVDLCSGETVDESGRKVGEWVFWLSQNDLKQECTLLLYSLADTHVVEYPSKRINGQATLILLNSSNTADRDFRMSSGKVIPANRQIYSNKSMLPFSSIIYPVSEGDVKRVIQVLSNCSCLYRQRIAIKPLFKYKDGKLIVHDDRVFLSSIDLSYKSWEYVHSLVEYNYSINLCRECDFQLNVTEYIRGVLYDGKEYVSIGFPDLLSVAYDRKTGLLLYLSVEALLDMTYVLPSVIVRTFGITQYSNTLLNQVWIKLLDVEF